MESRKIFFFELENNIYALDIKSIQRVIPAIEIVEVPQSPANVLGLLNIDNKLIVVIDLRQKLLQKTTQYDIQHYLLICKFDDHLFSFVIDKPLGIESELEKDIQTINENDSLQKIMSPKVVYYKDSPCPFFSIDQLISEEEILFYQQLLPPKI